MTDVGDATAGILTVASLQVKADGQATAGQEDVVVEAPLELMLDGEVLAVTMRTPGHDAELTAGFLLAEGHGAPGSPPSVAARVVRRGTLSSAACGVCGRDSIEDLLARMTPLTTETRFERAMLADVTSRLRTYQPNFARTGGLHAAALVARSGEVLIVREDVGRHNAVDKVLGRAALDGLLPLSEHVLVVSGRTSFEIVQKALSAGVPALVAVSAPSSLAIELAQRFRVLLIGFARAGAFTAYAGQFRLAGMDSGVAPE